MNENEVINNLVILISENAERKKDVNKYIDDVQLFLNTLNELYIPKSKIKEKLAECEKKDNENVKLGLEIPHWISVGEIGILNKLLEDDEQ